MTKCNTCNKPRSLFLRAEGPINGPIGGDCETPHLKQPTDWRSSITLFETVGGNQLALVPPEQPEVPTEV